MLIQRIDHMIHDFYFSQLVGLVSRVCVFMIIF